MNGGGVRGEALQKALSAATHCDDDVRLLPREHGERDAALLAAGERADALQREVPRETDGAEVGAHELRLVARVEAREVVERGHGEVEGRRVVLRRGGWGVAESES